MPAFRIHVAKDYLNFCSGHFVTYDGSECEPLHGHNYRASIRLEGPLDENAYVVDFVRVKKLMKRLCDELDHRMLLPEHNPRVTIAREADGFEVRCGPRRYVFPKEDVVLLPIANTTAELLAQHLCGRALAELRGLGVEHLEAIEVEVEETPGQSAIYRESL